MAISIEAISFESGCVIRHHRYDLELNAFKLGLWPVAEDSREVAGQCTGAGLGAKKPMPALNGGRMRRTATIAFLEEIARPAGATLCLPMTSI